jgi:hypothetical protein
LSRFSTKEAEIVRIAGMNVLSSKESIGRSHFPIFQVKKGNPEAPFFLGTRKASNSSEGISLFFTLGKT